jgi:hypothetical protein
MLCAGFCRDCRVILVAQGRQLAQQFGLSFIKSGGHVDVDMNV